MDWDTIEGQRSERASYLHEQSMIDAMEREQRDNLDDYPEFYYG